MREHRVLWLFKLMVMIVDFFFIFFNFILAIRYYNHVNFMINVPSTLAHKITPDYITGILNRGMLHYTLGMRGYYLGVLLVLWLFGPIWMLLGTVVLLLVLYSPGPHRLRRLSKSPRIRWDTRPGGAPAGKPVLTLPATPPSALGWTCQNPLSLGIRLPAAAFPRDQPWR